MFKGLDSYMLVIVQLKNFLFLGDSAALREINPSTIYPCSITCKSDKFH